MKVMIYDATCGAEGKRPVGLSDAWFAGAKLYRALRRFEHSFGARTWTEALQWLATIDPAQRLTEIQFWGHGKWGKALIASESLSLASLDQGHRHRKWLDQIKQRTRPTSLWWFRTCETFGADDGHAFATAWTRFFQCRAASHTYVIGVWQSGLHSLSPNESPTWPSDEGLSAGTPSAPRSAHNSRPWLPQTISCLSGRIPAGW